MWLVTHPILAFIVHTGETIFQLPGEFAFRGYNEERFHNFGKKPKPVEEALRLYTERKIHLGHLEQFELIEGSRERV